MAKKIGYFASAFLAVSLFELLPNYAGIVGGIIIEILTVFLYALASFLCSRMILPEGKLRWVLFLLCPIVLAIPYLLLFYGNVDTYAYTLKIFSWCGVWSLAGLIRIPPIDPRYGWVRHEEGTKKKTPWVWRPIGNCLLLVMGYFLFEAYTYTLSGDLGNVVYGIFFLMLYVLVISPLMAVSYCRKLRAMGWRKYLCCLYGAVVMSVPLLFLFPSSLLAGLITLIVYDVKETLSKRASPGEVGHEA